MSNDQCKESAPSTTDISAKAAELAEAIGADNECTIETLNNSTTGTFTNEQKLQAALLEAQNKQTGSLTNTYDQKYQTGKCGLLAVQATNILNAQRKMMCIIQRNSKESNTTIISSNNISIDNTLTPEETKYLADKKSAYIKQRVDNLDSAIGASLDRYTTYFKNLTKKEYDDFEFRLRTQYADETDRISKTFDPPKIDMEDVEISQTIDGNIKIINTLSAEDVTDIANLSKQVSQAAQEAKRDIDLGANALMPNSTTIQSTNIQSNEELTSMVINEKIQKINNIAQSKNGITINSTGNINMKNVKLDQNILLNIFVESIIKDAIDVGIRNESLQTSESKNSEENKTVVKGINDIIDAMGEANRKAIEAGGISGGTGIGALVCLIILLIVIAEPRYPDSYDPSGEVLIPGGPILKIDPKFKFTLVMILVGFIILSVIAFIVILSTSVSTLIFFLSNWVGLPADLIKSWFSETSLAQTFNRPFEIYQNLWNSLWIRQYMVVTIKNPRDASNNKGIITRLRMTPSSKTYEINYGPEKGGYELEESEFEVDGKKGITISDVIINKWDVKQDGQVKAEMIMQINSYNGASRYEYSTPKKDGDAASTAGTASGTASGTTTETKGTTSGTTTETKGTTSSPKSYSSKFSDLINRKSSEEVITMTTPLVSGEYNEFILSYSTSLFLNTYTNNFRGVKITFGIRNKRTKTQKISILDSWDNRDSKEYIYLIKNQRISIDAPNDEVFVKIEGITSLNNPINITNGTITLSLTTTSKEGFYLNADNNYEICRRGSYCLSEQMTPCQPGNYQSNTGSTGCKPCLVGTYQANTGSVQCNICQPGYYCPTLGGTTEISCSRGRFCPTGASSESICLPGSYSLENASSCTPCKPEEGKTQALAGAINCVTPDPGYYADSSTSALLCPSGYYCSDGIKKICPVGSYCGNGARAPTTCLPFTSTPVEGGISQSDCNPVDIYGLYGTRNAEGYFSDAGVSVKRDYRNTKYVGDAPIDFSESLSASGQEIGVRGNDRRIYLNWDIDGLVYLGANESTANTTVEEFYERRCKNESTCSGVLKSGTTLYAVSNVGSWGYLPYNFRDSTNTGSNRSSRYKYTNPGSLIITKIP
jgi:hypothetical protein